MIRALIALALFSGCYATVGPAYPVERCPYLAEPDPRCEEVYVWVNPHYRWDGYRRFWVPGRYVRRPGWNPHVRDHR